MEAILSCKQLLISQTPSKLIKQSDENEILHFINEELPTQFRFLFQQLKESNDQTRLVVVDSLAIWFLRVNQILNNKKKWDISILSQALKDDLLTFTNCHFIFEYVIDFYNDSSNALLNALRDLFHKFLIVLKLIYNKEKLNELFNQWMDQIMEISSTLRVQYYLIETLALDTDMFHIIEKRPNFIKESLELMSSESFSTPIGKCLVHLLINIYQFHFDSNPDKINEWYSFWKEDTMFLLHSHKYTKPLKLYLLTPLFKQMPSNVFVDFITHLNTNSTMVDPSTLLSLLKIGQELDINDEPFHNDELVSISVLESFLDNDEFKLPTFELLTFSKKKSKIIQPYILTIVKSHLHNFLVDVSLETRNHFESTFKSFILRIRDSCFSLQRTVSKLQKANKFPQEQQDKLKQLDQYKQFIIWLFQYLKMELVPAIQYQRCLMSLNLISILIDSGLDSFIGAKDVDKENIRSWPFNLTILNDKTLLRLLIDNLISPVNDIRRAVKSLLSQSYNSNLTVKETLHSMINEETLSKKAIQNMNAYQNTEAGATIEKFLFDISNNQLKLINDQLILLQLENDKTEKNPLDNVVNNISGYYISLTMFFDSLDVKSCPNEEIEHILEILLDEIMNSWDISKELTCHDSSDGLLPEKYLQSPISDQIITSYAFRTVKEMSKLLDIIINKYTLSQKQLVKIGDLLISQLFTIRHSGCFYAVLPTFRTFCIKCRYTMPEQLKKWLDEILDTLEVKTQHITRRSGGLPFLITNILATETSKDRPELKYCFDKFLNILNTVSHMEHQDKLDLPQITAFNCIKAIFIEAKLSEACTPYFPIALEYSLKYFKSDIWALRNCSLMLFTSLQNRIFGKIGKNISARLFFTKYDGIDKMLLQILRNSIENDNEKKTDMESTILVLSILMCLKQTPGYDGLSPFIVEVVKCLENKNWKIRDMAARTISGLVDDTHVGMLPLMEDCSIQNQNKLHGHLLAMKNILSLGHNHHIPTKVDDMVKIVLDSCKEFVTFNPSFVTGKAYLDVVSLVFANSETDLTTKYKKIIVSTIGNYFIQNFDSNDDISGIRGLCLATALEFLFKNESNNNINSLIQLGLESTRYEVQHEAIKYVENNGTKLIGDEDLNNIGKKLAELLLQKETLVTLKPSIIKAIRTLSINQLKFDELVKVFKESNSKAFKLAAIESLGDWVENSEHVDRIWHLVQEYLNDSTDELFRMAVLNCLVNCSKKIADVRIIMEICDFLQDDDSDIREVAAVYMNEYIHGSGSRALQRTSDTIARDIVEYINKRFETTDIIKISLDRIESYFQGNDIYSHKDEFEGLFDRERDNQFRNDIEQNIRWIRLIKECSAAENSQIMQFVGEEKVKLLSYLADNQIVDEPLGWMHSGDVLSKIIILRQLVSTFDYQHLGDFDNQLKQHKAHPLVFEYQYL